VLKHIAQIQLEFAKIARHWEDLPYEYQVGYLQRHPATRRKITAPPTPVSPTSGLKIHAPSRGQSRPILNLLRNMTDASTDRPIKREYLTMREGNHNKYHYFVVFPTKDNQYAAANAYGRIGYEPKAIVFSKSPSKNAVVADLQDKMNRKLKKGYKETRLTEEEA